VSHYKTLKDQPNDVTQVFDHFYPPPQSSRILDTPSPLVRDVILVQPVQKWGRKEKRIVWHFS
jgi:hypothetical protein